MRPLEPHLLATALKPVPAIAYRQTLRVNAHTCRTIVHGDQTDGQLAIVLVDSPADDGVPTHVHELEDEVFHVLEGTVQVIVDGRETILTAGQTAIGPRGVPHSWRALAPSRLVVSVTPSGLERMFAEVDAAGPLDPARLKKICEGYRIHFE